MSPSGLLVSTIGPLAWGSSVIGLAPDEVNLAVGEFITINEAGRFKQNFVSGQLHNITGDLQQSIWVGSSNNYVAGTLRDSGIFMSGQSNILTNTSGNLQAARSAFVGGTQNEIEINTGSGPDNAMVSGFLNKLTNVRRSGIICGTSIAPLLEKDNMVYVPSLSIWDTPFSSTSPNILIRDTTDEGEVKTMPIISTDANNTAVQGIDGGVFVPVAGGDNGMFGVANEAGTWAVNNFTFASGATLGTIGTSDGFTIGLNATNHNIKFDAINTFGAQISVRDATGFELLLASLSGQALVGSTGAIEFQPSGTNNAVIFKSTGAAFNVNLEVNKDIIDINASPGTAGQLLSSLGVGLGVDWIDAPTGGGAGGMFDIANQGATWAVTDSLINLDTTIRLSTGLDKLKFQSDAGSPYTSFSFNTTPRIDLFTGVSDQLVFIAPNSAISNNIYNLGTFGTRLGGTNSNVVHIALTGTAGQVDFPKYGLGNFGGTTAYPLAVQADGQVIEGPATGFRNGMFDAANDGGTLGVENVITITNGLTFSNPNSVAILNIKAEGQQARMNYNVWSNVSNHDGEFHAFRSRGTEASPLGCVAGDEMFNLFVRAYNGTGFDFNSRMKFVLGNTYNGSSSKHSVYEFHATAANSTNVASRLTIDGSDIFMNAYGLGSKSGTVAYPAAFDSSGKVIEGPATGFRNGMFDGLNDGDPLGVESVVMISGDGSDMSNGGGFTFKDALNNADLQISSISGSVGGTAVLRVPAAKAFQCIVNNTGRFDGGGPSFELYGDTGGNAGLLGQIYFTAGDTAVADIIFRSKVGTGANNILVLKRNQDVILSAYTSAGAKPGTAVANIQVDATGKLITTGAQVTQIQQNSVTTFYDNDAAAALGSVAVGGLYVLSATNTYGETSGMVKVRMT